MLATLFLTASAVGGVPTFPKTYTADVTESTSGTAPVCYLQKDTCTQHCTSLLLPDPRH